MVDDPTAPLAAYFDATLPPVKIPRIKGIRATASPPEILPTNSAANVNARDAPVRTNLRLLNVLSFPLLIALNPAYRYLGVVAVDIFH